MQTRYKIHIEDKNIYICNVHPVFPAVVAFIQPIQFIVWMIPQRFCPRMHPSHRPSLSCTSDWCRFPEGRALQPSVVTWRHSAGQRLPGGSPVHMGWWDRRVCKVTAATGHDGAAHSREGQHVPHSDKAMTQYCTHYVRLVQFLDSSFSIRMWHESCR